MSAEIDQINERRAEIKELAARVWAQRADLLKGSGEALANLVLAYRHLEDASMRLGKAIQALDGGASVYDRATTVGA